ncbi:hypothetical protein NL676_038840 [Syzygium grande]|nr:hypothetical protein NL676_038840 [Syzygium grande]
MAVTFMKCSQPVASNLYFDTQPCIKGAYFADTPPNSSQMKVYSYAVYEYDLDVRDIKDSCTITMMSFAPYYIWVGDGDQYNRVSYPYNYKDLHNMMGRDSISAIGSSI